MKDVVRLLDQLCHGKHGTQGKLFLVNVADTCEQELMRPRATLQYLKDLARHMEKHPEQPFYKARKAVSMRVSARGQPRYLRRARQRTQGLNGHTLHSTVDWHVFIQHCRKDGELPEAIPRAEPPTNPSEMQHAVHVVRLVTAMPGWHAPHATLGQPIAAANCWLATDGVIEEDITPRYSRSPTPADRARDKLGLIHHGKGVHLLAYRFSGHSLTSMSDVQLARPTFADFGNSRFRVMPNCKRSRDMSARGWGCTVDLALLSQERRKTIAGSAERITRSLPLNQLDGLEVRYLTMTTQSRGRGARENDRAFLDQLLEKRRSLIKRKGVILSYLRARGVAE
ncbi:hypothetical protein [Steroidobacter cummioxidans]|uniref:hypothetical protein n=1 Tax=Steroidobacter cummioxidans TaxID=1803913 RepID=UPI000E3135F7|nr:hypothetical protein [Steroidobacter cummioxidans]